MSKDYYKILGISQNASHDEVKRSFRRLAHKYHPDKEGGDEAKFKEVNAAYQVLSNPEKRKQYDQFGTTFENMGAGGEQGPFGGFDFSDFMRRASSGENRSFSFGFDDVFGDMLGMSGKRYRPQKGRDIEMDLTVDFKEAVFGAEKTIELYKQNVCKICRGDGREPGTKMVDCSSCGGSGQVRRIQNTILGSLQTVTTCPECEGGGSKPKEKCKKCYGQGTQKEVCRLKIKIPAGIDNGETLRIQSGGEAVSGGGVGDLYINIHVTPDKEFRREGNNILSQINLTFIQAALGFSVEIPTLDGKVKLKIPAGTQSGQLFRLRGKGVPGGKFAGGDHFVEAVVQTPTRLSKKQKKLLEEFDQP